MKKKKKRFFRTVFSLALAIAMALGGNVVAFADDSMLTKDVSIDFTQKGFHFGQKITEVKQKPVTVTFDHGSNKVSPIYNDSVYCYIGNRFTVSVGEGKEISRIELTLKSTSATTFTTDVGYYANGAWQPVKSQTDSTPVKTDKVTFQWASGNRYVKAVKVTYKTQPHTHDFEYTADGAAIRATCKAAGCDLDDDTAQHEHAAVLSINKPSLSNNGGSADATLSGLEEFNAATGLSVSANDIRYYTASKEGESYIKGGELETAPTDAADYVAEITVEGTTASVGYTLSYPDESNGRTENAVNVNFWSSFRNYSNGKAVTRAYQKPIEVTFAKGTGGADPSYYSVSNTSDLMTTKGYVQLNPGNTFTVSVPDEYAVKRIGLRFFAATDGGNEITADSGSIGPKDNQGKATWTGDAHDVTFTIGGESGSRRLVEVIVAYFHQHDLKCTAGTGEDANTIYATCRYAPNDTVVKCNLTDRKGTLKIEAPTMTYSGQTGEGISAEATITDPKKIQGKVPVLYYEADEAGTEKVGEALPAAPTTAGRYWAEITLGTGNHAATAHVVYTIEKSVTELIGELPDADKLKTSDKSAVEAVRKAYDALTKEQQELVPKAAFQKLKDSEAIVAALEKAEKAEEELKEAEAAAAKATNDKAAAEKALKAAEKKALKAQKKVFQLLAKVKITKTKGGKKKVTVKWKAVSGAKGYKIVVAKNKKGTVKVKTYTVKGAKKVKKVIKKLKKGKYYVKVRAYKKYKGNTVYGKFSKVKKVKVK